MDERRVSKVGAIFLRFCSCIISTW